ncbi:MAG TPA: hypothetical protein VIU93_01710 [Gallionellaceae bacterium]
MGIESEFRREVRSHLNKLDSELVPVLRKLIAHEYPEDVFVVAFEVFYDGFSSGFPARAFFLDEDNSEFFVFVDGEAQYPSAVDPGLLSIEQVYPKELENRFSDLDENLDTYTAASLEFIDWFSDRWDEAGGRNFSRLALTMIHDDTRAFDLKSKSWIEE